MNERLVELRTYLAAVRERWQRLALRRSVTIGAAAAATLLAVGTLSVWLLAADGLALVLIVSLVGGLAAATLACALWPVRQAPSDLRLARLVEERAGGLHDVLVTAVAPPEGASPIAAEFLTADAVRALRDIPLDRVVDSEALRRSLVAAASAAAALLLSAAIFAPSLGRAGGVVSAYLLPFRVGFAVTPGTAKVRAGEPLTITARVSGLGQSMTPALVVGEGESARPVRMTPTGSPGEFSVTIPSVTVTFPYAVTAGRAASDTFTITAIRPIRIERVDLAFEYPGELGLAPRVEEDSGDIYAPAGTRVRVTVTTDKGIARGHLAVSSGPAVALAPRDRVGSAEMTIEKDGSYRVALVDEDGFETAGDTEYFIRMLDDRPPNVRILRPGGDKQVTPVEEVLIEASADDDYGISSFDLVFQSAAGKQTVVPFRSAGQLSSTGRHEIHLEDLGVAPGDFVTYFARARDVARGRRGVEARSDIFFLEVKPFEEEFAAAQSQAMAGGPGAPELQELAEAQKDIIAATWKLDARARRAQDARSDADIKAVAEAQTALKQRAETAAAQLAVMGDPRRRRSLRPSGSSATADDPMAMAVAAMGRAAGELGRLKTATALPHEMAALEQLLKADADVKRRQVQRSQQAGGGGNGNRNTPDLSTLFDQQLRKQQETNYETPPSATENTQDTRTADPLDKIRELAKRQEGLNREQRDLARNRGQMTEEELRRQLERLTREQNQLREQAEELSRQLQAARAQNQQNQQNQQGQQSGSSASGRQGGSSDPGSRQMRDISEQMREAAGDLRRQDPQQASERTARALEGLRDLQRDLESARPDERRRALGDLQLETRQLADAERRLATETARTAPGDAGADARRRLAAEQERLADRTERLRSSVEGMNRSDLQRGSGGAGQEDPDARRAMEEAARELERQRIADRMRESAGALRQGSGDREAQARQTEEVARALDRIAERLGAAGTTADGETQRLSEQLARTEELRQQVEQLQRSMEALDREARGGREGGSENGARGARPGEDPGTQAGAAGRDGSAGAQGSGAGRRLEELQRMAEQQLRETQRLTQEMRGQSAQGGVRGGTPEDWWPSLSAPGTEAFKQDFAKWESLKKNLLATIEDVESSVSARLRQRENKSRLNAGRHEAVADSYRELVDRYYESLAAGRRKPQ